VICESSRLTQNWGSFLFVNFSAFLWVAEGQRADTALDGTSRGIQETKPQSHILMANIKVKGVRM
jgi:hypothetical protein